MARRKTQPRPLDGSDSHWDNIHVARDAAVGADGPIVTDPLDRAVHGRTGALTAVITHVIASLLGSRYEILATDSTRTGIGGIFRGHQHNKKTMEVILDNYGVLPHWQDEPLGTRFKMFSPAVLTFNVSPDSSYGINFEYSFDTYGILSMVGGFTDWTIDIRHIQMPEPTAQAQQSLPM